MKLSCIDYRLEPEKFGLSRPALYGLIRNLPEPIAHIRDTKALGFKNIVVGIRSKELWRRLINVTMVKDIQGIPYPRLVGTLAFFLGSIVHISYNVHKSLLNKVTKDVEEWIRKYEEREELEYFFTGENIPVRNCVGYLGFSNELEHSAREELHKLLNRKPYRSRMPFLDYIIVAALDIFPKLTLRQLRSLVYAARARLEEKLDKATTSMLKYKFIHRHYNALSEKDIVGRMWVPRELHGNCYERLAFLASSDCLEDVYIAASAVLGAANIVVSRSYVIASIGIPREYYKEIMSRVAGCVVKPLISYKARVFPLPFELYDPVRRVWHTEPVGYDLYGLLRKFRLVDNTP